MPTRLAPFCGLGHFHGIVIVGCQRLFAEDVLAGGKTLHRRRMMRAVRGYVGDGIELPPGDRILE